MCKKIVTEAGSFTHILKDQRSNSHYHSDHTRGALTRRHGRGLKYLRLYGKPCKRARKAVRLYKVSLGHERVVHIENPELRAEPLTLHTLRLRTLHSTALLKAPLPLTLLLETTEILLY